MSHEMLFYMPLLSIGYMPRSSLYILCIPMPSDLPEMHVTFILTLNAPIDTAADDIHKYFSVFFGANKT